MNAFFSAEKQSLMLGGQHVDWKNGDSFAPKKVLENVVELGFKIRPDSPTEFNADDLKKVLDFFFSKKYVH